MGNMSYCRFQNTVQDLDDCFLHFDDADSEDEKKARKRMIEMCVDIALDYGFEIDMELEEVEDDDA